MKIRKEHSPIYKSKLVFNTAYNANGEPVGSVYWNSADGTLDVKLNTDVNLQLGQEIHFYGKASGDIANGALVQFAGVQSDHILMKECVVAEIQANPTHFIGVATQSITNGSFGYVTWFGYVNDVYTDTPDNNDDHDWSTGDILFFNPSTGQMTNSAPEAPNTSIQVAAVIKAQTGEEENGVILVRPTFYHNLAEIEDVDGTDPDTTGQVLSWDNENGVWKRSAYNITDYSLIGHTHTISDVIGLQTELDEIAENIDGGRSDTNYGGIGGSPIDGGNSTSF